jgi:hypothetical protein
MKDRGIDALVNDSLVGTGTSSLLFTTPHYMLYTSSHLHSSARVTPLAYSLSVNTANDQSSCGEVSLILHFFFFIFEIFEISSFL